MQSVEATLLPFLAVLGCFSATANTNQLSQLLTTNQPCQVFLENAWVGEAQATVRTGYFTNADPPELARIQGRLRLNYYIYSDKPSALHFGTRTIRESIPGGGFRNIHTHRTELPSDEAIRACTTISSLTNLLGTPQGFYTGPPYAGRWTFFTLATNNSLETLSIHCIRTEYYGPIESLQIWRGVARQEASRSTK